MVYAPSSARGADHHGERRLRPWTSTFCSRSYGAYCRECGFGWSVGFDDAVAIVGTAPLHVEAALSGVTGIERHSPLAWNVVTYVRHVVVNLRIWAERLAGVAAVIRATRRPMTPDLQQVAATLVESLGNESGSTFAKATSAPSEGNHELVG